MGDRRCGDIGHRKERSEEGSIVDVVRHSMGGTGDFKGNFLVASL
jgi:hypothetical protein